jgi:ribosomal protein S18 acetylase RimI-like enzyme
LPELELLPAIERSAGLAFRGSSQDAVADGDDNPVEFYLPLQAQELVLVATEGGSLLGFSACQACEDALHLWELSVRLEEQRRGIGRELVLATEDLARVRGLRAVTLSTFRDIAWNAPFYARLGFVELSLEDLNPRLAAIREHEAALGLDIANRCAMRLAL